MDEPNTSLIDIFTEVKKELKMNIEIIGRIRPSIRAEGPENLVIEGHRVAAQTKGPFIKYVFICLINSIVSHYVGN